MSSASLPSAAKDDSGPRPRIALIGPLPPLRGGIAQHTEELRTALERRSRLLTLSFRRLYPKWLFPGETRIEPDGSTIPDGEDARGIRFEVDALDPRTWLAAVDAVRDHGSERAILPWWTVILAPPIGSIAARCRRAGIDVTFICHNVVDHEGAWWKRVLARRVLRHGTGFVVASKAEAGKLRRLRPAAAVTVHPHPVYSAFPDPDRILQRRSRRELLFFGLIRPYKGLDVLVEALSGMTDTDWHLTVAGEPWQPLDALKEQVRSSGNEERVEWIERYVPGAEAAALFERADAVVLPYRHATGCGVLARAIGQGKPVVASDLPGLSEQVLEGETGWLVPPGDPEALARTLREVDAERAAAMTGAIQELARTWTWDSLARAVMGGAIGDLATGRPHA